MRLNISHSTRYTYDHPVHYALQQIRLTPKSTHGQTIQNWSTEISGGQKQAEFADQHNNKVELVSIDPGVTELEIRSHGEVDTADTSGIIGQHSGYAPLWYFMQSTPTTQPGPGLRGIVSKASSQTREAIDSLHVLSGLIADTIQYQTGATHAATSVEEAIEAAKGVCQDHSQVFIAAARLMGHPARYVSGYLMMDDRVDQEATHAWAEAYVEGVGWIGFDVSNRISPDERYVRVATGLDYAQAAPVSGMRFGQSGESMIVSLQVQQ